MRLLVLGGTWFVGYAVAAEAVAAGWDVAVFNRGLTGSPPAGVRVINGDRAKAGDIDRVAKAGPWDAVVDTSGYVPVNVQAVARALEATAARYVFMSTVSVYEGWPMKALTDDRCCDPGSSWGRESTWDAYLGGCAGSSEADVSLLLEIPAVGSNPSMFETSLRSR